MPGFEFKPTPVVIDPYDKIVQSAYNKLPQDLQKNIDVIKLENSCPGDKIAWVTNQDLFGSDMGKKRVIHLCLKKIKERFQKNYGSPFTISDPAENRRMEELIETFLRDVVLKHEEKHIQQEIKGEGKFGPSSEPEAERAEDWSKLETQGIKRKIANKIDEIADSLEKSGKVKLAYRLDVISNMLCK